jgi:uncharacterized membrane protein YjgN (DUF898 family)
VTTFTTTLLNTEFPPEATSTPAPAPAADVPRSLAFSFTGSGREYFGIWIVNLLLTVLTLGVYSAWAKVRRTQYFYGNTWLNHANFNYVGQPGAILRGRVVALALLAAYYFSKEISPFLLVIVVIALAIVMPWLLRNSLKFRAHHSLHRGLRFRFDGRLPSAYNVFLGWNVAALISGLLLSPIAQQRTRRYQFHENAAFGTHRFTFTARAGQYYRIWFKTALMWLLLFAALFITTLVLAIATSWDWRAALPVSLAVTGLLGFWLTRAHYVARMQNLIWNHTTLGPHRFQSDARTGPLFWIMLKNALLTVFTLGLYRPFAVVHVVRYRLSCLHMIPGEPLANTLASESASRSAVGDEAAELFNIEVAL